MSENQEVFKCLLSRHFAAAGAAAAARIRLLHRGGMAAVIIEAEDGGC